MGPAEAQQVAEGAGVAVTLGLNWKLFLAQLVNFGLVLLVVWRLVYRPLMKVMDERSGRIERGLKDAEESRILRERSVEERQATVLEARRQAKEIIETADADGKRQQQEILARTRTEVERVVTDGKRRLHDEQDALLRQAKVQVVDLVIAAAEKVLKEKMTTQKDRDLVKSAVEAAERSHDGGIL